MAYSPIIRQTPFPIEVRDTAYNKTITGIVTAAVVDAVLSIPNAAISTILISIEQAGADIEVEFHRIAANTEVRKKVITAKEYVKGMNDVLQSNFPPEVETMMLERLQTDLRNRIMGAWAV